MKEVLKHIENSRFVLGTAWNGCSARLARKLALFGKRLKPDTILKSVNENDTRRSCILKAFKIFLAATYMANRAGGEIVFADLAQFRLLLLGTQFPIEDGEEKFLRANRRWIEILDARVRRDQRTFKTLMSRFFGDIIGLGEFQN
jgi:hypothetical protein